MRFEQEVFWTHARLSEQSAHGKYSATQFQRRLTRPLRRLIAR
jgi:hypothetical protein